MAAVCNPDLNSLPANAIALAPGVRRIVAGNAGMMTGPGTNTYLLGEREVTVVDPGPHDARHLDVILEAAGAPIRWILVTHTHRDHSPLVAELAQRTGAQIIGLPPPADGRQDESFLPHRMPARCGAPDAGGLRSDCHSYAGACLELRVLPVGARGTVDHRRPRSRGCLAGYFAAGRRHVGVHGLAREIILRMASSALPPATGISWDRRSR